MSFVSLSFLGFVAVAVALYYLLPKKFQWCVLLAASLAFYLFSGIENLLFIALTTLSTYAGARAVAAYAAKRQQQQAALLGDTPEKDRVKAYRTRTQRNKRLIIAGVMILNFGVLLYVKYYAYAATAINRVLAGAGASFSVPVWNILLPLGISFFTFQSIGYLIDVYRGKYKPETNLARFALFVSFFPQLVQGPIGRYDELAPQLFGQHRFDARRLKHGALLMLWGYFKKMVIADRLLYVVTSCFSLAFEQQGAQVLLLGLIYGLQIYCDFSGGIDVTRGVARAFGIDLALNFQQPFFANTMSDFWRRWHITLGAWMRDYVFYSLSLSKRFARLGKWGRKRFGATIGRALPTCIIAFISFFLIGIWHGPNPKYILFGMWNGGIVALGTLTAPFFTGLRERLHISDTVWWYRVLQILRTILLTTIGRIIGRAEGWKVGVIMICNAFFGRPDGPLFGEWLLTQQVGVPAWIVVGAGIALLFVVDVLKERGFAFQARFDRLHVVLQSAFFIVTILVILVFGVYGFVYSSASFAYGRY